MHRNLDLGRVEVSLAVPQGVNDANRPGLVPGLEPHRSLRDERLTLGGRAAVLKGRVDADRETRGGDVVVHHMHGHKIADPDGGRIVIGNRWLTRGNRGEWDDDDRPGCRCRAVGHQVGE